MQGKEWHASQMPWQVPLNSLCACLFFRNICCCNYVSSLRCRWRWAVKTDVAFCCFSLLKDSVWFCFMRGMNTNRKSEFVFQRNSEPWRIRSGWMRWPVLSCNLPLQELHLFLVWAGLGAVMHHYLGWSELIIMGRGLGWIIVNACPYLVIFLGWSGIRSGVIIGLI